MVLIVAQALQTVNYCGGPKFNDAAAYVLEVYEIDKKMNFSIFFLLRWTYK